MQLLAEMQLEFLGRSLWWVAIGAATGIALTIFGIMARRRGGEPAPRPGSTGPRAPLAAAVELPRFFGVLLSPLAISAGLLVLAGTGILAWWNRAQFLHAIVPTSVNSAASADNGTRGIFLISWLVLAMAVAIILFYRGVYAALSAWRRRSLIALRLAGMIALVLLLFRPVLSIVEGAENDKPNLAVIVDASASMGYSDAANQPNRYRQAVIAIENTLAPSLEKEYQLSYFAYDGRHTAPLGNAEALDTVVPDGMVTDLGAAIGLATSASDKPGQYHGLAGAVLFSDGIHNGPVSVEAEIGKLGNLFPVHTVEVGSSELEPSAVPDIAVISLDGPQTAIVNNQVILTASIKSTAMSDRTVRVTLSEKIGAATTTLDEQRLVLKSGTVPQTVQLKFTPDKVGRTTVRVSVPVDPSERSDTNNQQDFAVMVTDPKLTVLYVEGKVRPEVGPLRRALEQDPNLVAMSLVQTTAGRFEMSGAKIGTGADEIKGMPTTLAQWKKFKVVVLGDLDASFLNAQQQKDLEQAVHDGMGLVMIGGENSFAPGGWEKTTLAELLPVSLEKVDPPQIGEPFVPKLTGQGAAHPIFKNIATYFIAPDGTKGPITVPDLSGCVAIKAAKPGATILAVHPTVLIDGQPAIVLAVQQYGNGRTAAFAADTTRAWIIPMLAAGEKTPFHLFWGQLVRWLAAEENLEKKTGASVTSMLARERFESGETVALRAAVTDTQGQATNFAKPAWAQVTEPDGHTQRVELSPGDANSGQVGIYDGAYKPTVAGNYKVTFGASKDGVDLGKDESTFMVMPAAGERDVLAAQPQTLETISKSTDGVSVNLEALGSLVERLAANRPQALAAASTVPLFHSRWFFVLFIGCLGTEWFLRRRWQLM